MRSVLYYPYLNPSEEWLRYAALSWDRVYTLGSTDSPPAIAAIVDLDNGLGGLIKRLPVAELGLEITESFLAWVDEQDFGQIDLSDTAETRALARMHFGKMGNALLNQLARRGLARIQENGYDSFARRSLWVNREKRPIVYLPEPIALYYLAACASVATRQRQCDLFAETLDFASVAISPSLRIAGEVSTAILEVVVPDRILEVPVDRIAALRAELAEKRLLYQKEVQKLVDDVSSITSKAEMADATATITSLALRRFDDTMRTYKRTHVVAVAKTLTVASLVPGSVQWLSSVLESGIFAPAAITAGIAILAATQIAEHQNARATLDDSGWSYVDDLRRRL